jgi:hypothetical protein
MPDTVAAKIKTISPRIIDRLLHRAISILTEGFWA